MGIPCLFVTKGILRRCSSLVVLRGCPVDKPFHVRRRVFWIVVSQFGVVCGIQLPRTVPI